MYLFLRKYSRMPTAEGVQHTTAREIYRDRFTQFFDRLPVCLAHLLGELLYALKKSVAQIHDFASESVLRAVRKDGFLNPLG